MCDILKLHELMQISEERRQELDQQRDSPVHEFMKSDVYYCIGLKCEQAHDHREYDLTKIKGQITVSKNLLYFEPDAQISEQMAQVLNREGLGLNYFQACVDYRDIVSIQKIRGLNSTGKYHKDLEEQKMYLYDYYIQINVSSINGFKLQKIEVEDEFELLDEGAVAELLARRKSVRRPAQDGLQQVAQQRKRRATAMDIF